jgi:hypothetical protein
MSKGGTWRINNIVFPMPNTRWEEQVIGAGLNGLPILGTYRLHTWNWPFILGEFAEQLFSLFDLQQTGNSQLSALETDPYDASQTYNYNTIVYTDFTIINISSRTRGMPFYDDLSVVYEIYVP